MYSSNALPYVAAIDSLAFDYTRANDVGVFCAAFRTPRHKFIVFKESTVNVNLLRCQEPVYARSSLCDVYFKRWVSPVLERLLDHYQGARYGGYMGLNATGWYRYLGWRSS